jgi:hypothetical protein
MFIYSCVQKPTSLLTGFSKIFELLIYRGLKSEFPIHNVFVYMVVEKDCLQLMLHINLLKLFQRLGTTIDTLSCFFWPDSSIWLCKSWLIAKKMQFYGVKGVLLEWFKSYLYNRKQRVELKFSGICNYSSSWKTVKIWCTSGTGIETTPV